MTFIAMNRFRVALGREAEFEEIWRNRQSDLPVHARLRRFPPAARAKRRAGDPVRLAHRVGDARPFRGLDALGSLSPRPFRRAEDAPGLYLGPPQFEGFEAVAETTRPA